MQARAHPEGAYSPPSSGVPAGPADRRASPGSRAEGGRSGGGAACAEVGLRTGLGSPGFPGDSPFALRPLLLLCLRLEDAGVRAALWLLAFASGSWSSPWLGSGGSGEWEKRDKKEGKRCSSPVGVREPRGGSGLVDSLL